MILDVIKNNNASVVQNYKNNSYLADKQKEIVLSQRIRKRYYDNYEQNLPHLINSLEFIGMPDLTFYSEMTTNEKLKYELTLKVNSKMALLK